MLEKFAYSKVRWSPPAVLRGLYTIVLVAIGWVIFNFTDFDLMREYLASMFGGGTGIINERIAPIAINMIPLFAVSALASTPLVTNACMKIPASRPQNVLTCIFVGGLLILCTASMVSGAYNPFLYFRF